MIESMDPLWLSVARSYVGITETPGPASTAVILNWAKDIQAPAYLNDGIAWCAVFINRLWMACQMPMAGTGYDLLRAKASLTWGQPLPIPALGAVLVFQRSEGGHVGLYCGERADAYYVLGGNQGNAVSYVWIAKDRMVGCRWPAGRVLPLLTPVMVASDGARLSVNEA